MKCSNRPQEGPANRPYFAYKILGRVDAGGVSSAGIFLGDKNGMDLKNELVSGASIDYRGVPESHSRFRFRAGPWPYPSWGAGVGGGGAVARQAAAGHRGWVQGRARARVGHRVG